MGDAWGNEHDAYCIQKTMQKTKCLGMTMTVMHKATSAVWHPLPVLEFCVQETSTLSLPAIVITAIPNLTLHLVRDPTRLQILSYK